MKTGKCYLMSRKEERKEENAYDIREHIVVLKQDFLRKSLFSGGAAKSHQLYRLRSMYKRVRDFRLIESNKFMQLTFMFLRGLWLPSDLFTVLYILSLSDS